MNSKNARKSIAVKQRNIIIEAASICIQKQGLRGTTIADIAQLTKLGPGQIYRCFRNKIEIIEEIVQRSVVRQIHEMASINLDFELMTQILSGRELSETPQMVDDNTLILELKIEAMHNPRIAKVLQSADAQLMKENCRLIKMHYPLLDDVHIEALGETLAVLMEGSLLRNPFRQIRLRSHKNLQHIYLLLLNRIFEDWRDGITGLSNVDTAD
ncbi:TetR/AcrR family transcriptional regulator [Acerihabitans arboris]|uniref:TetR family transcriptional regulator n=1 Tax=Acerihabitans arboris TaxID=2691583 RepID=A0A845SPQ6_9GAMM|nr:TetR/AcrR family transcriptional regulator [Acerihabitans arboris]NDL66079.1 TetR family transcriptional regulator [Acerihabitans arboris]